MKGKLLTFFLTVCLGLSGVLFSQGQVPMADAKENTADQIQRMDESYDIQKELTLYTKEAADHLLNAGTYRGYYHDRQNLGIYMNQDSVLNICISNAEEFGKQLEIDLFVDDSAIEKTCVIPADGSWVSIKADGADYVPFIRTPQSDKKPVVNYFYSSEKVEELTVYNYGEDQDTFLETWASTDQEFAVIEGESITMLVPRGDMNYLPGAASATEDNIFDSIDEMLDFYTDIQKFYDEFVGLSYEAKDSADKNVKAKYFLKADKSGVGAAYYSTHLYIAQNAATIRGYLGEDYWMSLHEVAHGYDGEVSAGDFYLIEVANNILGHHYERTMNPQDLENEGYGWGNMQYIEGIEAYYQEGLRNGKTFETMDFYDRLYFLLNLLNSTDAKKMMSELHHGWRVEESVSTKDFIIESFSKTSGYNLIPYFEQIGVYPSEAVRYRLSEAGYPLMGELRKYAASDEEARQMKNELNAVEEQGNIPALKGIYGLVSAEKLAMLNRTGNVTVSVEIDDLSKIQGKTISLLDGTKAAASKVIHSDTVVFENVPIGTYRLELPTTGSYEYYTDYIYVDVIASENSQYSAVYCKADTNLLKNDAQIHLLGYANQLVAKIVTDVDAGKVSIHTKAIQPHWYFNDTYAAVKIFDETGENLKYSKEYVGNENYTAELETIDAPEGSIIKVYHREIYKDQDRRLKVASGIWGTYYEEYAEGFTADTTEVCYQITENGLKRLDWTEDSFKEKRINSYKQFAMSMDRMLSEDAKNDKKAYQEMKAMLVSAIETLDEEVQKEFKEEYSYLFEETVAPPAEEEDEVVRLFGSGRYETGYAVANTLKKVLGAEQFEAVVVATGKNFADALAGSYLAVEKKAPILLTNGKDANIEELHTYIKANVAEGGKVYILGGEAAVPAAVEAIDGYDVVRLYGDSRYDTNLAILNEAGVTGDSIIVATGKTFADSLSASAAKLPILLVKPNAALNDTQKEILAGMKNIYIVGGEGAVSAAYAEELAAYGEVTRVYGDSRYDTSVEIARTFCTDADKAVVASGKNFPDGLCGGPLAAALNAPLVLTKDGGTDAAAGYIAENAIATGFVLGGEGALTDKTVIDVFGLKSAEDVFLPQ